MTNAARAAITGGLLSAMIILLVENVGSKPEKGSEEE
jgi:hypothetical protein